MRRGAASTITFFMIVSSRMTHPWKQFGERELNRRGIPMLHLFLAALVAVITANIIAIGAIAALIRRDLARAFQP
jgi:hypothetical protein